MTLRLENDALGRLIDVVGERVVREAERLEDPGAPAGWMTLRITADWPEEVPGRLIGLGGSVEILDPVEIRDEAMALARAMLARHADAETALVSAPMR